MLIPIKPRKSQPKKAGSGSIVPSALKQFQPLPTHQQISQRAYAIYQSGGCADGRDQHDWLRAEKEIFAGAKQ